jgi:hypothetical protein
MPTSPDTESFCRVELPGGGYLYGFPSLKQQTTGCSAVTNLQTQLAPYLALIHCQFRILKLLVPLIDVIKGLPNPSPQSIQEFVKVADELAPCLVTGTSTAVMPFVRDLICLEVQSLDCFLHNLNVAANLAEGGRNQSGVSVVKDVLDSYQPIVGLLDIAADLFEVLGFPTPQAPKLSAGTDLSSIKADEIAVKEFKSTLETLADALGGC